ncbi:hypothetical protein C2G38_2162112 [Gigaspora rosea]|uniref:Uncharacterized protein n=1 Tax=Gigaspora rosea TaxID=44941 RepID=A0A397W0Q1_9GLOM|nr:hypothetical protein C2G38_2162112 [Gigaspora rosea]
MPCHVDTVVKVSQVHQTCNEDSKLFTYLAVGVYSVGSEDCELDMALFIPIGVEERDPNTQSIFETNEYYCVSGKTVLENYNGNLRLKMTVALSTHLSIKRDLVNDYTGKIYNFTIKVVFPHHNTHFKHLINSTRLNESILFVVGQMEIIEKNLYVYAIDISYIDTSFITKKKVIGSDNTPALYRLVETKNSDSCKEKGDSTSDLNYEDFHSSKRVRVVDVKDNYFVYCDKGTNKHNKDSTVKGDKYKENIACDSRSSKCSFEELNKGKESHSTCSS